MPAAGPDQGRQREPVKRDEAAARQSRQQRKCLIGGTKDHSSSSGTLRILLNRKVPSKGPSQWNFSAFEGHSDFFTLDPNLATALSVTRRGYLARPKLSQNVDKATREDGLCGETGVE